MASALDCKRSRSTRQHVLTTHRWELVDILSPSFDSAVAWFMRNRVLTDDECEIIRARSPPHMLTEERVLKLLAVLGTKDIGLSSLIAYLHKPDHEHRTLEMKMQATLAGVTDATLVDLQSAFSEADVTRMLAPAVEAARTEFLRRSLINDDEFEQVGTETTSSAKAWRLLHYAKTSGNFVDKVTLFFQQNGMNKFATEVAFNAQCFAAQ